MQSYCPPRVLSPIHPAADAAGAPARRHPLVLESSRHRLLTSNPNFDSSSPAIFALTGK